MGLLDTKQPDAPVFAGQNNMSNNAMREANKPLAPQNLAEAPDGMGGWNQAQSVDSGLLGSDITKQKGSLGQTEWGNHAIPKATEKQGNAREYLERGVDSGPEAVGPGQGQAETGSNAMSASMSGISPGMSLGPGMKGNVTKAAGMALQAMGLDPSLAGPMSKGLMGVATADDLAGALNNTKNVAISELVGYASKAASSSLKGFPVASIVGAGFSAAKEMSKGVSAVDAIADAFANIGVNMSAAAIGSLFGPIGTILGPMAVSMMSTNNLVTQGFIGDMFNSRNQESFRDAYEDLDISAADMAELDAMANTQVGPGSQLTQIERALGYSSGSGTGGEHNVGGAMGSATGTGGGFNDDEGGVSGL